MLAANTKFGIAAAVGACYAPLAFINLPLAIVIWMPLAFLSHTGVVGSAPTVMMILLGVAWIGALPASRSQAIAVVRRHGVLFGCLAALLAWTTASLTWANDLSAAAGDLYWWFIAAAVFLVLVTTLRDRRYVVGACWAIVIGALVSLAVAATVGTESDAVLAAQDAGRIGTSGPQDPNYLAAALIPAAAIAAGLAALTRSGPWRLVLILAMGVLGIGLLATGSRGGVVAAAFAVAASLLPGPRPARADRRPARDRGARHRRLDPDQFPGDDQSTTGLRDRQRAGGPVVGRPADDRRQPDRRGGGQQLRVGVHQLHPAAGPASRMRS